MQSQTYANGCGFDADKHPCCAPAAKMPIPYRTNEKTDSSGARIGADVRCETAFTFAGVHLPVRGERLLANDRAADITRDLLLGQTPANHNKEMSSSVFIARGPHTEEKASIFPLKGKFPLQTQRPRMLRKK